MLSLVDAVLSSIIFLRLREGNTTVFPADRSRVLWLLEGFLIASVIASFAAMAFIPLPLGTIHYLHFGQIIEIWVWAGLGYMLVQQVRCCASD
ncbi:MAG: hypothetical protein SVU32_09155 [Candidatus Nanohaloarchaea archaeon]|nr:hypothetical protein [Candidatus Nanohaloarchaea archaeon]